MRNPYARDGNEVRFWLCFQVSCGLVDESFGPVFALRAVWTARADNIPVAHCPPTLRPLAHKGYNNPIIFDTQKNTPARKYTGLIGDIYSYFSKLW
uniref:Uncharacterized protein n=1 Tax=Candidatus Kentrum sp. LPFa TaxID=2126335 RepID=A0A450VWM2_9GAMM|nr:MAG: hypothetical protein BECKLPF1236B_GA0070989_10069 [Candidatus Kentron sp. LPFa]